jgi:uncharacterized membrane protein YkoI
MKIQMLVVGLVAAAVAISAQETQIKMSALPAAVQQAARAEQSKGATLKGFAKEIEHGKVFYEVQTTVGGKTRDVLFDPTGQVVEIEEEVATSAVPPAAMKALAAHGAVTKVEKVTKGQAVSYESAVKAKSGKRVEVAVDADGRIVTP